MKSMVVQFLAQIKPLYLDIQIHNLGQMYSESFTCHHIRHNN